jgi:transcription termination factor NusB
VRKVNYEKYVKGKYIKEALKGNKNSFAEFTEKWENAAVAMQCIFSINSSMNNNAVKLLDSIPDDFAEKFENGKPIEYNDNTRKYIELFLRAQNYMQTISTFTSENAPKLLEIILQNKDKIDIAIYKYFVGNKGVVDAYANESMKIVQNINNSLASSFKNNSLEITNIKEELSVIFLKTKNDLNVLVDKFANTLNLEDIIKGV